MQILQGITRTLFVVVHHCSRSRVKQVKTIPNMAMASRTGLSDDGLR